MGAGVSTSIAHRTGRPRSVVADTVYPLTITEHAAARTLHAPPTPRDRPAVNPRQRMLEHAFATPQTPQRQANNTPSSHADTTATTPSPRASSPPAAISDASISAASSPSPLRTQTDTTKDGATTFLTATPPHTITTAKPSLEATVTSPPSHDNGADEARSTTAPGPYYRPCTRSLSPAAALGDYDGLPLSSLHSELQRQHRVYRICLTGGPCAGKSTMLAEMQTKLPQRIGFDVLCVPEAATLLVTGGMVWDGAHKVEQQLCLLRTQLALEDVFYDLAVATGRPTIVVSDRGTMDGRAFCTDDEFAEILRRLGCGLAALRDRYDAVIHLVTAALGAEAYYNLDNPARYEDLDGARASDMQLRRVYVGHPSFHLLDNVGSFAEKIERGLRRIAQIVGHDQARRYASYYLVRHCPATLPVATAVYECTTTILSNSQIDDIRLVMRRTTSDGTAMYFFKSIRHGFAMPGLDASVRASDSNDGTDEVRQRRGASVGETGAAPQRVTRTQRISSKEYHSLCSHRDVTREEVRVRVRQFILDHASFELMTILAPRWAAGKQTLSIESDAEDTVPPGGTAISFPDFLEVDRELPVESQTTAFLISHRETGPLYTSLAFAPVFLRGVSALGPHADVENLLQSTTTVVAAAAASPGTSRHASLHRRTERPVVGTEAPPVMAEGRTEKATKGSKNAAQASGVEMLRPRDANRPTTAHKPHHDDKNDTTGVVLPPIPTSPLATFDVNAVVAPPPDLERKRRKSARARPTPQVTSAPSVSHAGTSNVMSAGDKENTPHKMAARTVAA